jgi:hypothetical protein
MDRRMRSPLIFVVCVALVGRWLFPITPAEATAPKAVKLVVTAETDSLTVHGTLSSFLRHPTDTPPALTASLSATAEVSLSCIDPAGELPSRTLQIEVPVYAVEVPAVIGRDLVIGLDGPLAADLPELLPGLHCPDESSRLQIESVEFVDRRLRIEQDGVAVLICTLPERDGPITDNRNRRRATRRS